MPLGTGTGGWQTDPTAIWELEQRSAGGHHCVSLGCMIDTTGKYPAGSITCMVKEAWGPVLCLTWRGPLDVHRGDGWVARFRACGDGVTWPSTASLRRITCLSALAHEWQVGRARVWDFIPCRGQAVQWGRVP